MIVTTIALPSEVHRRLALAALHDRAALTELVRQAIVEWLGQRAASGRKPTPRS